MSSFGKGTVDDGLSLYCAGAGISVAGDETDVRESLATIERTDNNYDRMQTTFRRHCKSIRGKHLKVDLQNRAATTLGASFSNCLRLSNALLYP